MAQVCTNLAEACPGVYGRVVDLCKPSQKRLHVAVNVALTRYLDAVIVDTSDTARKCFWAAIQTNVDYASCFGRGLLHRWFWVRLL